MGAMIRVQVLENIVCRSHSAYNISKGTNSTILSRAIGKMFGVAWALKFGVVTGLKALNSNQLNTN